MFIVDDFSRLERQTLYTKREKLWFAVVNRARTTSKNSKGPFNYAFSFCTVINFIVLIAVAVLLAKGP